MEPNNTAPINKLPPEVLCLSKLPLDNVCVCRRVLKSWNQLIQQPFFIKLHHSVTPLAIMVVYQTHIDYQYPIRFGFVELSSSSSRNRAFGGYTVNVKDKVITMHGHGLALVGSCNGLICLASYGWDSGLVVCNPMLGTHFLLPDPPCVEGTFIRYQKFGFGYVPSLDHYKVVKIAYASDQRSLISYVCTIECGRKRRKITPLAWRKITAVDVNRLVPKLSGHYSNPVFYNGNIIWVAQPDNQEECFCLIYFDVQKEVLQTHLLPPEVCKGLGESIDVYNIAFGVDIGMQIGVYYDHEENDHLYLCEERKSCANIWVMETCNSSLESRWGTVKWVIHLPHTDRLPVKLFKVFEDGKLLISLKNSNLAHYDPSTEILETLDGPQLPGKCVAAEFTVDTPSLLGCLF